jgi:hypothetical protein
MTAMPSDTPDHHHPGRFRRLLAARCRPRLEPRFSTPIGLALLALITGALGGCSQTVSCAADYHGGCVSGSAAEDNPGPAAVAPVMAAPVVVSPPGVAPIAGPAPTRARAGAGGVALGEPGAFAEVDDRQCRSYGLVFGTHDYAECRIKLSAQHRGLDPNTGR